jgi:tetratricopeptide (TPR) repeat protein
LADLPSCATISEIREETNRMSDEHLSSDDYAAARKGGAGAAWLARRIHAHLLDCCPETRAAWEQLGPLLRQAVESQLARLATPAPPEPSDDDLVVDDVEDEEQGAFVDDLRDLRRSTYRQLWELRKLTPERRVEKILGATSRFRGPALAELLIEESRVTVRSKPAEAQSWAELVPLVLDWATDDSEPAVLALLLRAQAHRANALRILGDLAAADLAFRRLRTALAALPAHHPALAAEIASIEATLRLAQHELSAATELLAEAAAGFEAAGDPIGLARVRIQQGNLAWTRGAAPEALARFDAAAGALAAASETPDLHLVLCTVTGRVLALCALGRYDEAEAVLDHHQDDFEASEDPHSAAALHGLFGNVALGLQDFDRAESAYTACRDAHLLLGRYHDAALACLDVAEVLLAAGRTDDLLALAAELVPLFRNRQLPVETLRALDHLARAIGARRLSAALLAELRRRLPGPGAFAAVSA